MPPATDTPPPPLADVVLRQGMVTRGQIQRALETQKETAHSLGRTLIELGMTDEKSLISLLQLAYSLELIDLKKNKPDPALSEVIPRGFAEKHRVFPIRREGVNTLIIAMEDPSDFSVIEAIKQQTASEVKAYIATAAQISQVLEADARTRGILPASAPRTRMQRMMHSAIFYTALVVPLILFILVLVYNQSFQSALLADGMNTFFDIGLYTSLSFVLWGILLFEINGLFFEKKHEEE